MVIRLVGLGGLLLVLAVGWVAAFVMYRAAEIGELVSPIEPRQFDRLTVIAVGTGSSYENPERLGPSVAVGWDDRVLLIDAGRGLAEALRKSKIPVTQPEAVLLTNLLPVNTVGLDDLLYTGWLRDRVEPLRVLGPPGTQHFVGALLEAHRAGAEALGAALALPAGGGQLEGVDLQDGWSESVGGLSLRAGALPGGPLPALAYRLERGGSSVVVSGTGWGPDALVELARGADLLVHEGVYIPPTEDLEEAGVVADPERLEREAAIHTALLDVGGLAERAGVRSLALLRLRPPPFFEIQVTASVSETFSGRIVVPEDGDEIRP